MSVPDQSIDPRLLSAAKEEFLKKGFEKASLAKICKAAGVTTGALYKRYKGKEELFCALVSDTVRDMMEYVSGIGNTDLTGYSGAHGPHVLVAYGHSQQQVHIVESDNPLENYPGSYSNNPAQKRPSYEIVPARSKIPHIRPSRADPSP